MSRHSVAWVAAAALSLPFDGRWFVMQGGDTLNVNQHMSVRAQWYGLDFMKVGGESGRELHRGTGAALEDWYSWDQPVLAPADGEVTAAVDGLPDNPLGVKDRANPAGNHVALRTAGGWVFLGHLRRGTVAVKTGERVAAGRELGRCGNSGNSDAPHVHLHLQDSAVFNEGQGLNASFRGITAELSGRRFEGVDWPLIRGLFVEKSLR